MWLCSQCLLHQILSYYAVVLRRCSGTGDMRNEEAELKPKIWAVVTTCVVIAAHSFGMKNGRKLIPEVWVVM
nr:hypothetical protein [Tanacetum cinerariifolium]